MRDSKTKKHNAKLRRNIWRSLLIMKSAALSELPAVVSGLTIRNARNLMRDLANHGYVSKHQRHGRPEYFQIVDSPSLPDVCRHCGKAFDVKACSAQQEKRTERQKETQRETERHTETQASSTPAEPLTEVTHDAA